MADNVDITPGTGVKIATDEVTRNATTQQMQIVKIGLGAESAFDTLVDSGQQTMANSVPVAIASDQTPIPVQGNASDNAAMGSQKPTPVGLKYNYSPPTYDDGDVGFGQMTVNGFQKVTLAEYIAGEDITNNVMRVEHQYSYSRKTADGQVKATAGFIHTVTFSATGTVTAGVITIYDSASESGTVVWSGTIQVGLNPTTIVLDVVCGTGIYVGYDGTIANVATTVSYR